jgi:hypothetical protein
MAGSLNGSAVRRSKYGLVLQSKANLAKSVNNPIARARSLFGVLAYAWRIFPDSEREDWNNIAIAHPVIDRFGGYITLTGYAYFMRVQMGYGYQFFGLLPAADYNQKLAGILSVNFDEVVTNIATLKVIIDDGSGEFVLHAGIMPAIDKSVQVYQKSLSRFKQVQFVGDTAAIDWDKRELNLSKNGGVSVGFWLSHKNGWIGRPQWAWHQFA